VESWSGVHWKGHELNFVSNCFQNSNENFDNVPNCQKGVLNLRTHALLDEQPKGLSAQTLGDIVSAFYHQIRNTLT
jgi:hypothetical protein